MSYDSLFVTLLIELLCMILFYDFRFVTLLMELLCMMFQESEIIPDRTTALKAER